MFQNWRRIPAEEAIHLFPSNKKHVDNKNKSKENSSEKNNFSGFPSLLKIPKDIDKKALELISQETAKEYKLIAFEKKGNALKVAMVNPQDVKALNVLRFLAESKKVKIKIYLISEKLFQNIISWYDSAEETVDEIMKSFEKKTGIKATGKERKREEIDEVVQGAPVAKLVGVIIKYAVDKKASDIHIEPIRNNYRVRFRIDGILRSHMVLPNEVGKMVVSHIKILSKLKIDEKRKPQDGRFKIKKQDNAVDFRVSTFPVLEGEKVVLRVLSKNEGMFDLDELGAVGRNKEVMVRKLKDSFGIILMTGPTGSGKSTTLYSLLKILNQEERNIITLEDPVEYFIEGINQSQIKPEIGYTFASGLRSILRQDPNIIMVGEIRDSETAELATHAALTGHLVFSTLHTNNAIGAIPRLVDMGVAPFLMASSLKALAAQRLVRKICPNCKEEIKIPRLMEDKVKKELENVSAEEAAKYKADLSEEPKFYRGKGCKECNGSGFKGRIAIYEVLEIDDEFQKIISEKGEDETALKEAAKRQGMLTMKQDGILKVLKGMTTLSEIERVTEGSLTIGGKMDDDKG